MTGLAPRPRSLAVNGIRLHALECGRGPLVLLVHGFPEIAYSWRHQMEPLARAGYRVVAFDQRGFGRSSKLARPTDYLLSRLVGDVLGVLDALGEATAVVVGHDWGAAVAWTAAWAHPERFRGVAGLSVPFSGRGLMGLPGSPFGERRPGEVQREIAGPDQLFYQEYLGSLDAPIAEIERDLRGWLRGILVSGADRPGRGPAPRPEGAEAIAQVLRASLACVPHGAEMRERFDAPASLPAWLREEDLDVYAEAYERSGFLGPLSLYHCIDRDWEELAPLAGRPLRVPALFLAGDFDVVTLWARETIARFEEVAEAEVEAEILEGVGHWIQQERPEAVNARLLAFLERVAPAGRDQSQL